MTERDDSSSELEKWRRSNSGREKEMECEESGSSAILTCRGPCRDFNHISYVGMTSTSTSTSNSNPDTLNLKNDQKQTESKVSSPPISEFPDGSQSTDSNLDNPDHENGKEEEKSEILSSSIAVA
ncbi:unnamed protein product [Camellia sinensis]